LDDLLSREAQRDTREVCRDFGQDSSHSAGLNFGDCFVYVLASEPMLFKN